MNLDVSLRPAANESGNPLFSFTTRYLRFGPFQIDVHRQELSREGSRLHLQGKALHVLLILLEKPGEVVTREELRQRLWPAETHVNYDANVNTTVNKLRQVLGDSSDRPLYIETLPRRGYCLVVQPEFSDQPFAIRQPQLAVPAAAPEPADTSPGANATAPSASTSTNSGMWLTLGMIGLILAGMLLGAGIATLWISHAASSALAF